jgi:hypothetical protein
MTADARRQNRVQNWEAKLAAMDAARRQYNAQAGMSPIQGALAFMPAEGFKMGTGAVQPTLESVKFNPETDTQFSPMDAGDDAPMSGANMRVGLEPTPEMTGLGGQFNMKEDIGYDPYKEPLRAYPAVNQMYNNMFDPYYAAKRARMLNRKPPMPMVPSAYNDVPAFGFPEEIANPRLNQPYR